MSGILTRLLGINWKTTLAGLSVIVAAIGRIALAWRIRDFDVIITDGQLVLTTVIAILTGIGLLKAKDQNVTGVGISAKAIDSSGTAVNREGDVVGKQPS